MRFCGLALFLLPALLGGGMVWGGGEGESGKSAPTISPKKEEGLTGSVGLPPLRVSGTVISPPMKTAFIVILDEECKEAGIRRAGEGETVEGYRVVLIQTDRVSFERDGQTFVVPVRHDRPPVPSTVPAFPSPETQEGSAETVPSPAEIEEMRKTAESFFERLQQNSDFKEAVEEVERRLEASGGKRPNR